MKKKMMLMCAALMGCATIPDLPDSFWEPKKKAEAQPEQKLVDCEKAGLEGDKLVLCKATNSLAGLAKKLAETEKKLAEAQPPRRSASPAIGFVASSLGCAAMTERPPETMDALGVLALSDPIPYGERLHVDAVAVECEGGIASVVGLGSIQVPAELDGRGEILRAARPHAVYVLGVRPGGRIKLHFLQRDPDPTHRYVAGGMN